MNPVERVHSSFVFLAMKTLTMKTRSVLKRVAPVLLTVVAFILLSPKWLLPPAAAIAPFLLILVVSTLRPWKAYLLAVAILFAASLVSQFRVMPFPGIFFPVMLLVICLQSAVPYFLNRLLYPRIQGWTRTLVFPSCLVTYEYVTSFGGGGSWSSIAYTQVPNSLIIQGASLGGIWLITFLIGWFASLLFFVVEQRMNWKVVRVPVVSFFSITTLLTLYSLVKTNALLESTQNTVRVAGVATNHVSVLQTMYEDSFGRKLDVNENELTQNSPELAELNKGFAAFIEDPYNGRFVHTRTKLIESADRLFDQSRKEAQSGSKIICWSEAAVITIKSEELRLFEKGENFARENGIYFLMTVASIIPGKVEAGKKFIENKAVLFDPSGKIQSIFFKNRPVPLIEPSIPGDGKIPVIDTPYGKLAVSICYDADFPQLMRQLGKKDADILLLPSGDWKEVSPYHGQMALVRAIENGTSLIRPVSGAVSIACDFNGKIIAQRDFFDDGEKIMVGYLPVEGVTTIYSIVGDVIPWICAVGLAVTSIVVWQQKVKRVALITSTQ